MKCVRGRFACCLLSIACCMQTTQQKEKHSCSACNYRSSRMQRVGSVAACCSIRKLLYAAFNNMHFKVFILIAMSGELS